MKATSKTPIEFHPAIDAMRATAVAGSQGLVGVRLRAVNRGGFDHVATYSLGDSADPSRAIRAIELAGGQRWVSPGLHKDKVPVFVPMADVTTGVSVFSGEHPHIKLQVGDFVPVEIPQATAAVVPGARFLVTQDHLNEIEAQHSLKPAKQRLMQKVEAVEFVVQRYLDAKNNNGYLMYAREGSRMESSFRLAVMNPRKPDSIQKTLAEIKRIVNGSEKITDPELLAVFRSTAEGFISIATLAEYLYRNGKIDVLPKVIEAIDNGLCLGEITVKRKPRTFKDIASFKVGMATGGFYEAMDKEALRTEQEIQLVRTRYFSSAGLSHDSDAQLPDEVLAKIKEIYDASPAHRSGIFCLRIIPYFADASRDIPHLVALIGEDSNYQAIFGS